MNTTSTPQTNSTEPSAQPAQPQTYGLWCAGSEQQASDGETFSVLNPATEQPLANIANATPADWFAALDAADADFPALRATSPTARAGALREIGDALLKHQDTFGAIITAEMGKPFAEARGEVRYGASYFHWFADEAIRIMGRTAPSPAGNGTIITVKEPVGPVVAITPWNFPLAMAARKIAPAIAVGCPVLVKPADLTPLTLLAFAKLAAPILQHHGLPAGTLSVLPTKRAKEFSATLMADERVKKVTFTGSTAVGRTLVEQSAQHLQRTSMELGGNAPVIVAADANLALALEGVERAKMRNGGEACNAANRILVHSSIAAEFTAKLVQRMQTYVLGNGMDEGTRLGPIISAGQRDRIATLVNDAISQGATLELGGKVPTGPGYFYPATVLSAVKPHMDVFNEEIFGPVSTITTFETLDEALELANATPYGLAAYAYSQDIATCQRFAAELQAGMVGINRTDISDAAAPFGGIGASGFGREGGVEGIEEYVYTKYIALPPVG